MSDKQRAWYRNGIYPIRLCTSPETRISSFATGKWLDNYYNVTRLQEDRVGYGESGTFTIEMQAPEEIGTYTETFSLLADGFGLMEGPEVSWNIQVVK